MKEYKCDVPNCKKEASQTKILSCTGYKEFSNTGGEYKPFEKPIMKRIDLCEKHFREWCKETYNIIYKRKE